jgi:hypothetical protein
VKLLLLAALSVVVAEPLDTQPDASVVLTFSAYSSDESVMAAGGTGSIRVDAVWIQLQDARVRPTSSCKRSAARAVIPGSFAVELMTKVSTAAERVSVAADQYCAFEIKIRRASSRVAGAPTELRGASVVVLGHRGDGARFVLQSRADTSPVLQARALDGFAPANWILGIDVARWFKGVDLGTAELTPDTRDRIVRIDTTTNPELLSAFDANVNAGLTLFVDANADRILDTSERASPVATPR